MDAIPPDLLRTLLAIDEAGTFTAAAQRVGRTQAAVSQQMSRLEEIAGARLFRKEGRRVGMTVAGEKLLSHARRILGEYDRMRAAFQGMPLAGHVRLGAPDDYAQLVLPAVLARFGACHPQLSLELVCSTTEDLLDRISTRTLDMALVTTEAGETIGRPVKRGRLAWIGRHDLVLLRQDPVPLALFPVGCRFRREALEVLERTDRPHRIAYTSSSVSGIIAAVRAGLAVTVLPEQDLGRELASLPPDFEMPALQDYGLSIWRNEKHSGSALFRTLEQHIAESLRDARPSIAPSPERIAPVREEKARRAPAPPPGARATD